MEELIDYKQKIEELYNNIIPNLKEESKALVLDNADLKLRYDIVINSISNNKDINYLLLVLSLVGVFIKLGESKLALEQCKYIKNSSWDQYIHLFNLSYATVLLNTKNLAESENVFESIDITRIVLDESTKNNYYIYYSNYAKVLMMLEKYSKASKHFELALKDKYINNYHKVSTYLNLNFCYRKTKEYDKALLYIEKLITMFPKNLNVSNQYIFTYKEMGDYSKVHRLINERKNIRFYSNEYSYINIHQAIILGDKNTACDLIKNNIIRQVNNKYDYLYQYKTVNNAMKSIIGSYIYAGNPNDFNDHTDPYYRLLPNNEKFYYEPIIAKLGIACLTTQNDNLLMWSHYAQRHQGVCIEYKIQENRLDYTLCKVDYSQAVLKNGFNAIYEDNINNRSEKSFVEQISTKPEEWKYENEYRLIKWIDEDNYQNRCIQVIIKAVYLGKEIHESDRNILNKLCQDKQIHCYQMETDKNNLWKLTYKPV